MMPKPANPAAPPTPEQPDAFGDRIRRYREQRGLSLSGLALRAGVSKSYVSTLESDPARARRPSIVTLQRLAAALGVLLSDLTGGAPAGGTERSPALLSFAADENLPQADVEMLSSIQFRGDAPRSKERWRYIYNAIRTSETLDRESNDEE